MSGCARSARVPSRINTNVATMTPQQYRPVTKNGGWLSFALRKSSLLGSLFLALTLIVGIAGLAALSLTYSGFVAVNGDKPVIAMDVAASLHHSSFCNLLGCHCCCACGSSAICRAVERTCLPQNDKGLGDWFRATKE